MLDFRMTIFIPHLILKCALIRTPLSWPIGAHGGLPCTVDVMDYFSPEVPAAKPDVGTVADKTPACGYWEFDGLGQGSEMCLHELQRLLKDGEQILGRLSRLAIVPSRATSCLLFCDPWLPSP